MKTAPREREEMFEDQMGPECPPMHERVRRLPEALLLTAGYYASRSPTITELLHRLELDRT